jgi:hypothetical protein
MVLRTYHPKYLILRRRWPVIAAEIVRLARTLLTETAAVPTSAAA